VINYIVILIGLNSKAPLCRWVYHGIFQKELTKGKSHRGRGWYQPINLGLGLEWKGKGRGSRNIDIFFPISPVLFSFLAVMMWTALFHPALPTNNGLKLLKPWPKIINCFLLIVFLGMCYSNKNSNKHSHAHTYAQKIQRNLHHHIFLRNLMSTYILPSSL
jgi:hypothetical protein